MSNTGAPVVTVGGLRLARGSKLLQHNGCRIEELTLVEPYEGTTLWIARNADGERRLVETRMP